MNLCIHIIGFNLPSMCPFLKRQVECIGHTINNALSDNFLLHSDGGKYPICGGSDFNENGWHLCGFYRLKR